MNRESQARVYASNAEQSKKLTWSTFVAAVPRALGIARAGIRGRPQGAMFRALLGRELVTI